jgi:DNA-binding XRE family transcriptional regulator
VLPFHKITKIEQQIFLPIPLIIPQSAIYYPSSIEIKMNLSKELRIRREQLGVTQEYLADLSGVGFRTIKSFESGKANPRLETLTKLSEVLSMELVWAIRKNF